MCTHGYASWTALSTFTFNHQWSMQSATWMLTPGSEPLIDGLLQWIMTITRERLRKYIFLAQRTRCWLVRWWSQQTYSLCSFSSSSGSARVVTVYAALQISGTAVFICIHRLDGLLHLPKWLWLYHLKVEVWYVNTINLLNEVKLWWTLEVGAIHRCGDASQCVTWRFGFD